MRKRLVVVAGAASALLLAGGVSATSASAEETSDFPGFPGFSMPNFFGWGQFGDDSDDSDQADAPDDSDISGTDDQPHQAQRPRPAATRQQHAQPQAPDRDDQSDQDVDADADADDTDDAAARPAQDTPGFAIQRPAAQQRPATQHQATQHQATQHQADRQPAAQQQPAAAGLTVASRRDVSAADVSASPGSRVQQEILALINQNRRRHGCGSVSLDRRLIDAANEHAADMARRRYFAHESPNGDGAGDRVRESGYKWKRYGENIARGVDSPYEVVDGWMHSPEHRENILDCSLHQMGVGLAISGDRRPYWVQDFATPMTH
jgi:uncharacterized protein YkwD